MVEETNGAYICQAPVDLIALGNNNLTASYSYAKKASSYFGIGSSAEEVVEWMGVHSRYYLDALEWIESMKQFDLVVGMRIHGVMAGIQAGTPSLCICIDSRTQELCETMHLPWVDAREHRSGIALDEISSVLKSWDWGRYDSTRMDLYRKTIDFFDKNKIINHPTIDQNMIS
jgi:hypothetical protein